jgi:hypothetical protein
MTVLPAALRRELLALQRLCLELAQSGNVEAVGYITAVAMTIRAEAGDPTIGKWPMPGSPVPPGWDVLARVVLALADDWVALRLPGPPELDS